MDDVSVYILVKKIFFFLKHSSFRRIYLGDEKRNVSPVTGDFLVSQMCLLHHLSLSHTHTHTTRIKDTRRHGHTRTHGFLICTIR